MRQPLKSKSLLLTGASAIVLLGAGTAFFGLALGTQAQGEVEVIIVEEGPSDQDQALSAVAKMTEGQRTYYAKHNKFEDKVNKVQKEFGISLPSSYDYAIRTTDEAAYNYVIPKNPSSKSKLNAYVGAAFLAPDKSGKLTSIICENNKPGKIRPADPDLVRGTGVNQPTTEITLECGDYSTQVPASKVTER